MMIHLKTASTANITSGATLQNNERFRRLIPYMTFYFAQQNYRNQPQYQDIQSTAPVLPVSNKLHVPQYQGNLVVPNSYLLRYNPRYRPAPRPPKPLEPRPFSPNKNNQESLQPPRSYQLRITPSASDDSIKLTLSQILNLLQAIRKLPHIVPTTNHNTNPSQLYSVVPQTSHLPTNNGNNQIRGPHLQYTKLTPVSQYTQTVPSSPSKYLDSYEHFNSPISNVQVPKYTTKYYEPLTAISSTTSAPLRQDDDYDTYDEPDPQQIVITTPKVSVKTTPSLSTKVPLVQISTPAPFQLANDLQNYDYSIEDLDSPHIEEPLKEELPANDTFETTKTSNQDMTQNDALQTYGYASKVPQYNHYQGHTTTQIFPDPNAEGGTPGRPGIDYPTYSRIPETSFSCKNQRYKGFFGDPETSCQVWHYCDLNGGQASFLCPNGTIFSQVGLTCDWWFNVRCASTAQLYVLNERLYKYILPVAPKFPEDYSGPLVDQYLTLKFQELESKKKNKEKGNNKSGSGEQNKN